MSKDNTIVVAIDLSDEADQVLERASSLSLAQDATLHVVHVVEPISFAYGGDMPMDYSGVQEDLRKQAEQRLAEIASRHSIPDNQRHLLIGRPATEIHALADEVNADLIVVGSHGRHGLSLLLGSTANAVLHGADRDVLAVRVGNTD